MCIGSVLSPLSLSSHSALIPPPPLSPLPSSLPFGTLKDKPARLLLVPPSLPLFNVRAKSRCLENTEQRHFWTQQYLFLFLSPLDSREEFFPFRMTLFPLETDGLVTRLEPTPAAQVTYLRWTVTHLTRSCPSQTCAKEKIQSWPWGKFND